MAKAKTTSAKKTTKSISTVSARKKMSLGDLKQKATDPKNRKSIIIALSVVVVVALLYLGRSLFIAATVNGQPIPRLVILSELEKQSGKVVLDNLITRVLVKQEAEKNNVVISEEDINKEIEKISGQFKEQGQDLKSLLAAQGLSEDKFREEVKIQLIVTKLLGESAKVSDQEFEEFMTQNPDLISEEEDQKEAKKGLKTQLEQQKLAQKYQEWMQKIREQAKINFLVDY